MYVLLRASSRWRHNDVKKDNDITTNILWLNRSSLYCEHRHKDIRKDQYFPLCHYIHAVMLLLCHHVRMFKSKHNDITSFLSHYVHFVMPLTWTLNTEWIGRQTRQELDRQIHSWADRFTLLEGPRDRQTDRQTGRQTGREAGRQADGQRGSF